jgi:hypothetical protein
MLVLIGGCAPVETVRIQDHWRGARGVIGPSMDAVATATVEPSQEGAIITIESRGTCTKQVEDDFHRRKVTERRAERTQMAALWGLGGLGAVLGGVVLVDARKVPEPGDQTTTNPIGRTEAYAIGGSLLAVGAALLVVAAGTSSRAHDEIDDLGTVTTIRPGSQIEVPCNVKPVARHDVVLTGASSVAVPLGKTGRKGRLEIKWEALERLFAAQAPAASGAIEVPGVGTAGKLDLAPAKAYWAQRTLADAIRLAAEDKVDEATIQVKRAAMLGADISAAEANIAAAPTSIRRAHQAEQKALAARAAKEKEVGGHLARARQFIRQNDLDKADNELTVAETLGADTTELRDAMANTPAARSQARDSERLAKQQERKSRAQEAKGSGGSELPFWTAPIYPEVSGTFTFVKILNQSAGEALFEAKDGLFVLHLSPGDSFSAYADQGVQMTIYSKGQHATMTNGQMLPLFWSGHSPVRTYYRAGNRGGAR